MAQEMQYHEGEYYDVVGLTFGRSTGFVLPNEGHTIEDAKKAIDRQNNHYKSNGFPAKRYGIVKIIWNRTFYPDGTFYEENTKRKLVMVYPEVLEEKEGDQGVKTYIKKIEGRWYAFAGDTDNGQVYSIGNDNPKDGDRWFAKWTDGGIKYVASWSASRDAAYQKARKWGTYSGEV